MALRGIIPVILVLLLLSAGVSSTNWWKPSSSYQPGQPATTQPARTAWEQWFVEEAYCHGPNSRSYTVVYESSWGNKKTQYGSCPSNLVCQIEGGKRALCKPKTQAKPSVETYAQPSTSRPAPVQPQPAGSSQTYSGYAVRQTSAPAFFDYAGRKIDPSRLYGPVLLTKKCQGNSGYYTTYLYPNATLKKDWTGCTCGRTCVEDTPGLAACAYRVRVKVNLFFGSRRG